MNAVERVTTAMKRGTPDRVPFIPQICPPHAILMLGLDFERTIIETLHNPKRINELDWECARRYGVDGLRAWIEGDPIDAVKVDGVWCGRNPQTGKMLGRIDFEGGGAPVAPEEATVHTMTDIDAIPVPTADELLATNRFDGIKKILADAGDDFFVITPPGEFTFQFLAFKRGKEQAMVDLHERPDFCHRMLEKALAITVETAAALTKIGVHCLYIGDTFGGVIGPDHFREFCVPYARRLVSEMETRFGARRPLIHFHVCGNSTRLWELMADTGVDCIDPLDPLGGAEVRDAKRRVGNRVSLMGGVNTVKLAHGTLQEVKADTQRCLREGAPGGGYVLACGDMLPTETSREKVETMRDAAQEWSY